MIRKLLATTAIITIVSTGAFAQTSTTTTTEPAATTPSAATDAAPAATDAAPAGAPVAEAEVTGTGQLASNLIGETVYNGTGDDAANIGEVNDLVIGTEGQVEAIVIGVGGFLGIGEKNVAVDYETIDWAERDGDRWIVIATTADQLKELPDFDRAPYAIAPVASNAPVDSTTAPAGSSTTAAAPATTTEPAATTMAPATTAETPAATTDTTANAAVDRATLKALDTAAIRSEELVGTTVYGANDENVGEIGDIVLSQDGKVESVIIDVGGFLGMGEKEVAIGMDNLSFLADEDGDKYLYTAFTKEQLDAAPAYDEASYGTRRDEMRLVVPN